MKAGLLVVLMVCFLVACNHKPDPRDARIAELERKVELLQGIVSDGLSLMKTNIEQLQESSDGQTKLIASAILLTQRNTALYESIRSNWDVVMPILTNAASKQNGRSGLTTFARPPYPAMKEGVPIGVYNEIEAKAVKDWPADYEMQAYAIRSQIAAYKKLYGGQ